jgi:hypothetical protein
MGTQSPVARSAFYSFFFFPILFLSFSFVNHFLSREEKKKEEKKSLTQKINKNKI